MKSHDEVTPVQGLLAGVARIREAVGPEPTTGSPADVARQSFTREESVLTADAQTGVFLEAAADNLRALDRLITMGEFAISPWVNARASFEACALVNWLLDRDIEIKERVGRSLALRYEALRSQEKFANVTDDKSALSSIQEQLDKIEQIAIECGFRNLQNDKCKRTGIAVRKPSITVLMSKLLGADRLYRILSGVAHSDYVVLRQLSYSPAEEKLSGDVVIIPVIDHKLQKELLVNVAAAYARVAWLYVIHFGCNVAEMVEVLENCFDELELPDLKEIRFWRSGS